jgi:hypothetical protein
LAVLAAAYLYGFSTFVILMGVLKRFVTTDSSKMLFFLLVLTAVLAATAVYRKRHVDPSTRIIYDEAQAGVLSLSADHGYWLTPQTAKTPATITRFGAAERQRRRRQRM